MKEQEELNRIGYELSGLILRHPWRHKAQRACAQRYLKQAVHVAIAYVQTKAEEIDAMIPDVKAPSAGKE